jgi:hypothetical protein
MWRCAAGTAADTHGCQQAHVASGCARRRQGASTASAVNTPANARSRARAYVLHIVDGHQQAQVGDDLVQKLLLDHVCDCHQRRLVQVARVHTDVRRKARQDKHVWRARGASPQARLHA